MNNRAANSGCVVPTCTEPMFFTPLRLTSGGSHSPHQHQRHRAKRVLTFVYKALYVEGPSPRRWRRSPAHAVIQYDQAFGTNAVPESTTDCPRYGPPSAGSRRDNAAKSMANASAPMVVSPIDTNVIGP